jgi:hypothetical protein
MILSLIFFLLTIAVAFFHYVQGFFSATISAILVVIAAVVAVGYHEQVAPFLFSAKFYDQAESISLVVLFAAAYIIPRLLFDKAVPGNVRLPVLVDKIGAGAAGVVAGLFSVGVLAIAAQALPFGPGVGMYSRFEVADKTGITYPGLNGQNQDTSNHDVTVGESIDSDATEKNHLWLWQDDLVNGLVKKITDGGSLEGDRSFASIHPDWMDELFGQRIGIQVGAKHTLISTPDKQTVSVKGVYAWPPQAPLTQIDGELPQIRGTDEQIASTVQYDPGTQVLLIVRTAFSGGKDIGDDVDGLLRLSPGSVRLVAGRPDDGAPFKDYYPAATLDPHGIAVRCRIDDFLVVDTGGNPVDFCFVVDKDHLIPGDAGKFTFPADTFIEVKRYGQVDLAGKPLDNATPPPLPLDKPGVLRKGAVQNALGKGGAAPVAKPAAGAGSTPGGAHDLGDTGLTFQDAAVSDKLFSPIDVKTADDSGQVRLPTGVGGDFNQRKWSHLTVSADTALTDLAGTAANAIAELAPSTAGDVIVQIHCLAPTTGSDQHMWNWGANLAHFQVSDSSGHAYKCVGAWARVSRTNAQHVLQDFMVTNYQQLDDKGSLQAIQPPASRARPTDVWLAFEVPAGTAVSAVKLNDTTLQDGLNLKAQ